MSTTYTVYNPNTSANSSDWYLVEIRQKGWLIDYKSFQNKRDAEFYGKTYCGNSLAPKVIPMYEQMILQN